MTNNASAIEVSLNASKSLATQGNIVYSYQNNPSTLSLQITTPIVCSSLNNSSPTTIVTAFNDSNNLPLSILNHNIINTEYDFINGITKINTDNSIQCATENGILNNGTLFMNGFDETDLQLDIFNSNGMTFPINTVFSDQDTVEYQYVITNNGESDLSANLTEHYPLDNSKPFFSGVLGDDWSCNPTNIGTGSTTTCGDMNNGEGFVRLQNASINPGEKLIITVSHILEVPNATLVNTIELLSALFTINNTDSNSTNNVTFQVFSVQL